METDRSPLDCESPGSARRYPVVCGRVISGDQAYYPSVTYHEGRIRFCTGFCLEAFQADPERFYRAHSRQTQD